MFSSSYTCPEPDFLVRAVSDNQVFPAKKNVLSSNSDVFRDMFCCVDNSDGDNENILDLHENATLTVALLSLVHQPPRLPVVLYTSDPVDGLLPKIVYDPSTVIPFPVLSSLFSLADKYALSETIAESLKAHLLAHAPTAPLQVYCLALSLELNDLASKATQYLKPLAEYAQDEIKSIPSINEDIFPHGYGSCSQHLDETTSRWQTTRISLAIEINHLTDVAGEMERALELSPIDRCTSCRKACIISIEMLRYKCRRVPKEISRLVTS
ncbi:hypothetical protein E1B28_001330 [Marasmius oreades]|uniref:BTB domain-containing protein n=1 Tax=Marasmius oreades TaxID=181124 RepID=A0A9P7V3C7_9AGAR|nr:uncharacterized protein E1B28_001330 [Marasmius oreades]KAG7099483.1 hypothetical protein E1B28_001330 [Marasmius oreades]